MQVSHSGFLHIFMKEEGGNLL